MLLVVVSIAIAATILLFRQDRVALLARQVDDTKIVQLKAVRAALQALEPREHRETMQRIGREYGVRIIPEAERPMLGANANPPRRMEELEARLREQLGPRTVVRSAPGRGLLFVASRPAAKATDRLSASPTAGGGRAPVACGDLEPRRRRRVARHRVSLRLAILRGRCATSARRSSASAAVKRRRRSPNTGRRKS